jgi:hypothetical protein
MTNELSSEVHSDKCALMLHVLIVTNNLLYRAVSMHLKMTGTRHTVNFINHGNYDKRTGLI